MTFVLRSVFFSVLCLSLMSLACSESKNAQLDRKALELGDQLVEIDVKKECSEKKLSEVDCNKAREGKLKEARKAMQDLMTRFDEMCKGTVFLEDECVEKKQEMLKLMVAESNK